MCNCELCFGGMRCRKINEVMLILCRIAIAEAGSHTGNIPLINCLFRIFASVCLHSRSSPLHADWRKSDSSVDGEPQGNWRRNSNSKDLVVSSTFFSHPADRVPRIACLQANGRTAVIRRKALLKTVRVGGEGALV